MNSGKISNPTFNGKRIGGYMYAHINALSVLPYKYRSITEAAIKLNNEFDTWNVVKTQSERYREIITIRI